MSWRCCEAAAELRSYQSHPRSTWIYSPQTVEGGTWHSKHRQHPQARIWDSVFLKFLWILKSYQRVVCLRLCAMLRPWSVGCSFKELFWLEVLQGVLLERDAPAAELSMGAAFLGWASSQHITHDLVTKLLSMLKVKSQSLSIWSFPGGESFYFFYSPLVDAEGEGGCICCCIFLYGSCIESSLLSIL